jgi:hypothetical protein
MQMRVCEPIKLRHRRPRGPRPASVSGGWAAQRTVSDSQGTPSYNMQRYLYPDVPSEVL